MKSLNFLSTTVQNRISKLWLQGSKNAHCAHGADFNLFLEKKTIVCLEDLC